MIKPGYKQTEIGVIPKDWGITDIQNIANITTGAKNTQDKISDGDYPFFVRSQTVERINTYSFDGEAVLTAGDGVGTGKVFHYVNGKFDYHQRVYNIHNFSKIINGYFFYLYFSSNFYKRISQLTAKSSVDSVRREMIAYMKIPLPPTKEEQTAIATALSDMDSLISSLEQLIAKKRAVKQGAMQELLTPKVGVMKSIDSLLVKNIIKPQIKNNDMVVFIGMEDISQEGIVRNQHLLKYSTIKKGLTFFQKHDVLVAKITPCFENGKGACLDKLETCFGFGSTEFHVLKVNHEHNNKFLFYHTQKQNFRKKLESEMIGTAGQKRVPLNAIKNYKIFVPSLSEQTRIATILSDMDSEIEKLEVELEKYKQIKQGMMQSLLTGKIRLI